MSSFAEKTVSKSLVKNLSQLKEYNFDKRYVADSKGNVYLIKGDNGKSWLVRQMKPYIDRLGYVEYVLTDAEGKKKHMLGQRIVAGLFLTKPRGKDYVNHKDGNRSNNNVKNLEYMTHSENVQHSYDKLRSKISKEELDLEVIHHEINKYYRRVEYWFYKYFAYQSSDNKKVDRDIYMFNRGFCYNGALVVAKIIKLKYGITVPILFYTRAHAFLNVLDKYYDTEHTLGCEYTAFYNYLVDKYNKAKLDVRLKDGEKPTRIRVTDKLEDLEFETELSVAKPSDIVDAIEWCINDDNARQAGIR